MMNIRITLRSCALACVLASAVVGTTAMAGQLNGPQSMAGQLDGAQYLKQAKVTLKQARATALKTMHGKIVSEELEKEKGGSGLRYSFDIKKGTVMHEVGVDAKTGKVLESSIDEGGDEGDGD